MFDVHNIIQTGGLLAVGTIIFAESGLLLGFFLPGDTLLLTAGLFAGQGHLSLGWLLVVVFVAAVVGYQVGYEIGERIGPRLFKRKSGILLRKEYIQKTQEYFMNYGAVTIIGARFIAHVRTFVSVIAGAGKMDKRKYLVCNILGALLWGMGITLIGYWLGSSVANIDKYFFPAIIAGLVIIYTLAIWGLAKSPTRRVALKKGLKEDWDYFFRHIDN
jgi:membrane-associated protein